VATGQHQMRSEGRVYSVLGSPRLPRVRRENSSFEESVRSIRRKRRMSSTIERERTRLAQKSACSEEFQGQVTAGDGSDK